MARTKKPSESSGKVKPKIDPRVMEFADTIFALMKGFGWSQNQLAAKSGVGSSHLSKYFRGERGLGVEQFLNVVQALNAILAIRTGKDNHAPLIGTLFALGRVEFFGESASMPGVIVVDADHGRFRAGDRIEFREGVWEDGKYAVVKHPDGAARLHKCELRGTSRLLVSAESILFDPDVHEIVGIATSRTERL